MTSSVVHFVYVDLQKEDVQKVMDMVKQVSNFKDEFYDLTLEGETLFFRIWGDSRTDFEDILKTFVSEIKKLGVTKYEIVSDEYMNTENTLYYDSDDDEGGKPNE